jgi:Lrp/AsnC family transcriptional regulator, leucine-responsive regulatory protein
MEPGKDREIDAFDLKIMDALSADGRMSITDLAHRVGLSKTPCQIRLRRLVEHGYIGGFRAVLNPEKLGLEHIAFVEVKLSDTKEAALARFNDAVRKLKEVEECHLIAGRFDYLLKVRTSDIKAYRRVLGDSISQLPFVASTSTSVAMEAVKEAAGRIPRISADR